MQELFKRLIPHQCLGATWSRRDRNEANTVLATVTQFNAVSFRVISSILIEPKLRPQVLLSHNITYCLLLTMLLECYLSIIFECHLKLSLCTTSMKIKILLNLMSIDTPSNWFVFFLFSFSLFLALQYNIRKEQL